MTGLRSPSSTGPGWVPSRSLKKVSSYGSNGHTAVVVYPPSTAMICPVM